MTTTQNPMKIHADAACSHPDACNVPDAVRVCCHPRSCRDCQRTGEACGAHLVGTRDHRRCTGHLAPPALLAYMAARA